MVTICSNVKCSYVKNIKADYCPECGAKTRKYGFREGTSLIYAKKKYRNEHKKSSESGFIFCEKCNGYYELQPGEYKENFDNCDCGGKLKFVETIEAVFDEDLNLEEKICPVCGTAILNEVNFCEECGAGLNETESVECEADLTETKSESSGSKQPSLSIRGVESDAEISNQSIIIYKKFMQSDRRTGKNKEYLMKLIGNVEISDYNLEFKYNGENINFVFPKDGNPRNKELKKFFKNLSKYPTKRKENLPKKDAICTNEFCINLNHMKRGSACPDCGSPVKKDGFLLGGIRSAKKMLRKESKKIAEKKSKYGFLRAAPGMMGRLELYDNRIRLPGKEDYLIEDIISIDLKMRKKLGSIEFHIRGENTKSSGGVLTYGPHTGFNIGLIGSGKANTRIAFHKRWENEFREIKKIVEAQMLQNRSLTSNEPKKTDLSDLEKLAELRDKGIITEEEFKAKKKQILGL